MSCSFVFVLVARWLNNFLNVLEASSGQDSDVDSSHSYCSGSDTHSGHTSLSGLTDKGSITGPTVQVSCSSGGESSSSTVNASGSSPGIFNVMLFLIMC